MFSRLELTCTLLCYISLFSGCCYQSFGIQLSSVWFFGEIYSSIKQFEVKVVVFPQRMFHLPVFLYTPSTLWAVRLNCGSVSRLNLWEKNLSVFNIYPVSKFWWTSYQNEKTLKFSSPCLVKLLADLTFAEPSPLHLPSELVTHHIVCDTPEHLKLPHIISLYHMVTHHTSNESWRRSCSPQLFR